jgi:hypothetical protein
MDNKQFMQYKEEEEEEEEYWSHPEVSTLQGCGSGRIRISMGWQDSGPVRIRILDQV